MKLRTFTLFLALIFFVSAPAHAIVVGPAAPAATVTPAETTAKDAAKAYKAKLAAMTPAERRAFKKAQKQEMKEAVKQYKQDVKNGTRATDDNTILLVILAILLPPVAVLVHQEELNSKFWIALLLTLLFYLPGLIYALLVILGDAKKK
ncbi:MAG: YqaE/Pmp3 family membrane protein [Lewinella sp.]